MRRKHSVSISSLKRSRIYRNSIASGEYEVARKQPNPRFADEGPPSLKKNAKFALLIVSAPSLFNNPNMRAHAHTDATKTAIGYVRISTEEQASDGVSLDVQRDRLCAYCRLNGIKLIGIKVNEGYSGNTLHRRDGKKKGWICLAASGCGWERRVFDLNGCRGSAAQCGADCELTGRRGLFRALASGRSPT